MMYLHKKTQQKTNKNMTDAHIIRVSMKTLWPNFNICSELHVYQSLFYINTNLKKRYIFKTITYCTLYSGCSHNCLHTRTKWWVYIDVGIVIQHVFINCQSNLHILIILICDEMSFFIRKRIKHWGYNIMEVFGIDKHNN